MGLSGWRCSLFIVQGTRAVGWQLFCEVTAVGRLSSRGGKIMEMVTKDLAKEVSFIFYSWHILKIQDKEALEFHECQSCWWPSQRTGSWVADTWPRQRERLQGLWENILAGDIICSEMQQAVDVTAIFVLYLLLDAIASPSTYPRPWVGQWVSQWSIVSDLEIAIASPSFASKSVLTFLTANC